MKWKLVYQQNLKLWHVHTDEGSRSIGVVFNVSRATAEGIIRDHNAMLAFPGERLLMQIADNFTIRQIWPEAVERIRAFVAGVLAMEPALGAANENSAANPAPPEVSKKAQLGFEIRYGWGPGSSTILVVAKDGSEARRFFEIIRPQATIYAMLELNQYVFYPAEWASCFASSEGKREPAAPSSGMDLTVTFTQAQWSDVGFWLGKYQGGLSLWHKILDQLAPEIWEASAQHGAGPNPPSGNPGVTLGGLDCPKCRMGNAINAPHCWKCETTLAHWFKAENPLLQGCKWRFCRPGIGIDACRLLDGHEGDHVPDES